MPTNNPAEDERLIEPQAEPEEVVLDVTLRPQELSDFVGQPCKSRLAYEFIPKKGAKLDLGNIAGKLRSSGVLVETETPFLLMLKIAGKDCTLFRTGKII